MHFLFHQSFLNAYALQTLLVCSKVMLCSMRGLPACNKWYQGDKNTQQELSSCWDGRPFGRNRHRPKVGRGCCGGWVPTESPYNTLWPGPRPTSLQCYLPPGRGDIRWTKTYGPNAKYSLGATFTIGLSVGFEFTDKWSFVPVFSHDRLYFWHSLNSWFRLNWNMWHKPKSLQLRVKDRHIYHYHLV